MLIVKTLAASIVALSFALLLTELSLVVILLFISLGVNAYLLIGRIGLDTKFRIQDQMIKNPDRQVEDIIEDDIYKAAPFRAPLQS